jgi:hypothetical protein
MQTRALLLCLLVVVPVAAQGGILSLSPTSVNAGAAAFTLTVNGLGFASGNILQWDGTNLPTTFVSSTQLTASVTAAQVQNGGTHTIRNKVNATFNNFSNTVPFNVNHPAPVLSSISPTSATAGGAGFTLTATGSAFTSASVIRWDGTALPTTFVSPASLTTAIPASLIAAGDAVVITVTTPSPGGGTSITKNLNVNNPSPQISGILPFAVSGGITSQTVVLSGSGFVANSLVLAGEQPVQVTSVTSTQLTAVIPQNLLHSTTVLPIRIFNGLPGGGTANSALLVTGPAIESVSPAFVPVMGAGAAPVTLTVDGSGFAPGDVVRVNGASRPTTVLGSSAVTFTVDTTLPFVAQPGGFAVTVFRPGLVSNAIAVRVGTAAFPDNDGTVTIAPVPPSAPGQLFDIRVEVPIRTVPFPLPNVPMTLVADLASPSPFVYTPPGSGLNLVVGPGLGSPVVLADGLGLMGPSDGSLTHGEDLSTFGVSTLRSVYRSAPITLPGTLGMWISFAAVWGDIASPISFSVTPPSGPYFF